MSKEYKCYRGEYDNECCKNRVEEAVKYRTYVIVLILGVACMIIALTMKFSNNSTFLNQISFASTVTSIILSIIAIWMSISGERNMNDVKQRVSDSANRLEVSTKESEKITNNFEKMLSEQEKTFERIINELNAVSENVGNVKMSVGELNSFIHAGERKDMKRVNNSFEMFQNVFDGIRSEEFKTKLKDCCIKIFEKINEKDNFTARTVWEIIKEIVETENDVDIFFGMIVVLRHNGFFFDDDNKNKIQDMHCS